MGKPARWTAGVGVLGLAILGLAMLAPSATLRAEPAPAIPPAAAPAQSAAEAAAPAADESETATPAAQALETARQTAEKAASTLRGQSLQVGLGYAQNVAFFTTFKDLPRGGVSANLTDNGRIAPLIQYSSSEKQIASFPLQQQGRLFFGYNLLVTYDQFDLNRQLTDNFIVGRDLDTRLQGDYVAVAPLAFLRLGPLFSGSDIFWKLGGGIGAAAIRFHGDVVATRGGETRRESVSTGDAALALYATILWEFQVNRWALLVKVQDVFGGTVPYGFSLEQYAMTAAYTIHF